MSGQHRVNLKIVCKENYKYEVQEKSPANQAVTMQQLAEEYWRSVVQLILSSNPLLLWESFISLTGFCQSYIEVLSIRNNCSQD